MWEFDYKEHYYPDYLCHYGVKGMKWGVRRTPEQLGYKKGYPITVERPGRKTSPTDGGGYVRPRNSLSEKVDKTHLAVRTAEKTQGLANTALQASKGHQLLSTKARNNGDNKTAEIHARKSKVLLSESQKYEKLAEASVAGFLKTKAEALYESAKVTDGAKLVDSLAGLTISQENIDKYERQYSQDKRYVEGYNAEHQHVQDLKKKY